MRKLFPNGYKKFKKHIIKDDYCLIQLTKGQYAKVDKDDFDKLKNINWCFDGHYAVRNVNGKTHYIHHFIMGTPNQGLYIDHINLNTLNNCKSNLRIVTSSENSKNKIFPKTSYNSTTNERFISWDSERQSYRVEQRIPRIYVGRFKTLPAAIAARDKYLKF